MAVDSLHFCSVSMEKVQQSAYRILAHNLIGYRIWAQEIKRDGHDG